jgi:hypothetical protein
MSFPLKPLKTFKKRVLEAYPQAQVINDQGQVQIPEVTRDIVLDGRTWCTVVTRWTCTVGSSELVITKSEHVEWKYFEDFEALLPKQIEKTTSVTIRRDIGDLIRALPGTDVPSILLAHYKAQAPAHTQIYIDGQVLIYQRYYVCEKVNAGKGAVHTRVRHVAEPPVGIKMISLDL